MQVGYCELMRSAPWVAGERRRREEEEEEEEDEERGSSSSSIGRDSDHEYLSGYEDEEVQSKIDSTKGPFDTMDVLQDALPIKKGISKYYSGKSKSFTSLADASSVSSIQEFAKPENPYTRKRKNELSSPSSSSNCTVRESNLRDLHRNAVSCMPRRPVSTTNRNTIARTLANNAHEHLRPPLHPQGKQNTGNNQSCALPPQRDPHWRSFSYSDLQRAVLAGYSNN